MAKGVKLFLQAVGVLAAAAVITWAVIAAGGTTGGGGRRPSGGAAAAYNGKAVYRQYCAACHGVQGQGYAADAAPALNASNPDLRAAYDQQSLAAFVQVNMPANQPGSLNYGQAKAVAGYVWNTLGAGGHGR